MSLLRDQGLKKSNFGWNLLYFSKKTPYTKLETLSKLNLDLSQKVGKVVIN